MQSAVTSAPAGSRHAPNKEHDVMGHERTNNAPQQAAPLFDHQTSGNLGAARSHASLAGIGYRSSGLGDDQCGGLNSSRGSGARWHGRSRRGRSRATAWGASARTASRPRPGGHSNAQAWRALAPSARSVLPSSEVGGAAKNRNWNGTRRDRTAEPAIAGKLLMVSHSAHNICTEFP
jgi:hypothetical protein